MEWYEVQAEVRRTVGLASRAVSPAMHKDSVDSADYLGGIIHEGRWGWVTCRYASEAILLVCRLASGETVARHTFWRESGGGAGGGDEDEAERSSISCVEELFTDHPEIPTILAVCLESWHGSVRRPSRDQRHGNSQLYLYSVYHDQVLRRLDLNGGLLCSSLAYLEERICSGTRLARFEGCLALATEEGIVLLIDLNYSRCLAIELHDRPTLPGTQPAVAVQSEPHLIVGDQQMPRLDALLDECRANRVHLAIELDVARVGIRCLVGIPFAPGFAAGLDDARILIYDLVNFKLITALRPPKKSGMDLGVVQRMCIIMPPDDPKPCFYICALYRSPDRITMMLHSVNYSYVQREGDLLRFQQFYSSSVRNYQVLDINDCSVVGCSTASTFSFAGDNGTQLILLSWHSHTERKSKLVLFDMNQWYKDEMPEELRLHERPHYMSGYMLNPREGFAPGLALLLRPTSILHFVALQRCEEHFYPNSLTFDCCLLTPESQLYYAHDGVQRCFLNALRRARATLFLRPQLCLEDIIHLRLLPQFCELNGDATFSRSAMYDVILSVALEHRCVALLNDCARSWLDGSFLCNMLDPTELSLGTLTNWIVRRAGHIKQRISELCQGIFDYGGYPLDERERREFETLSEQMAELVRLQAHILKLGRSVLTSEVLQKLESNERALQVVNEYQKVLYWFIAQGLLPEGQQHESQRGQQGDAQQQQQQQPPLVALRRSYAERRTQRKRLYIDTLTQQTCLAAAAYPPDTLQALLRVMVDPDTELAHKHELILYMLMDLDQELAQRFPSPVRMQESSARSVFCFWWLDRGDYKQCLSELYDKRIDSRIEFEKWQTRFLVETLMEAGDIKAAIRVVRHPPGSVSAALEMEVLLANNLVPEAFHNARLALDEDGQPLVERFFRRCIENRRYRVLADLCLTEHEEQLVYRLLLECRTPQTECVQLILLLQKCKYIEAVNFMDDVAARRKQAEDEASSSIISAYRATMAPLTQNIAGAYFRVRGKLDEGPNAEHRQPLSCQLARQNAGAQLGGIFQSSAISALWAEHCPVADDGLSSSMRTHGNVPFLRHEQYGPQMVHRVRTVRPVPHQIVAKRPLEVEERDQTAASYLQPCKRRRLLGEQLMEDIRGRVSQLDQSQSLLDPVPNQWQMRASDLVQPPAFLQTRKQPPARPDATIPTILKRRSTVKEHSVVSTPPSATSTSLSQPKRFRFQPPIPLRLEGEEATAEAEDEDEATEETEEAEEVEEEETDEIIMEIESPSEPRSAYSAETDEDEEEEEDVFLSPLSSVPVSRVQPRSAVAPPAGPQPRGSLLTGIASGPGSKSSSGFGSFATVQPAQTTTHSQFVPTVCSSKMYETQSQVFSSGGSCSLPKISERTTICGDMESTDLAASVAATASSSQWSMPAAALHSGQALRMLDTTLDMTTYDTTSVEQRGDKDGEQEEELVVEESEAESPRRSPSSSVSSQESRRERRKPMSDNEEEPEEEEVNDSQSESGSGTSSGSDSGSKSETEQEQPRRRLRHKVEESDGDQEEGEEEEQGEEKEQQGQDESEEEGEEEQGRSESEGEGEKERARSDSEEEGEKRPAYDSEEEGQEQAGNDSEVEGEEERAQNESEDEGQGRARSDSEEKRQGRARSDSEDEDQEQKAASDNEEQTATERSPPQSDPYARMIYPRIGEHPAPSPTASMSTDASSRSVQSEPSPPSSPEMRRQRRQEAVLESSNDEEGSITTSRSVTHTPEGTTFLPSDTNVSQNSSPRAPDRRTGGEGSPRSLYRANSLETVDDLDTTKGSLEEEEEDDEDDCVIALDGTEVRGYVARPQQPATACSSAELFAFKDEADEAAPGPRPSLSLGATVNSDSVAADIIQVDSSSDEEDEPRRQEMQVDEPMSPQDVEEREEQPVQEEDSRHSLKLAVSEEEDEEVAAMTTLTPRRSLRPRRSSAESHQDSPIARRVRLRSDDSGQRMPSVNTPKRHAQKHKALLEVIDEQGSLDTSLPRTRSRSRLGSVDPDVATPSRVVGARHGRGASLAPTTAQSVESPRPRRSSRGLSEPPTTPRRSLRGASVPASPAPTAPQPVRTVRTRVRRASSKDPLPASPVPFESEQPRLRRTSRRHNSEQSETSSDAMSRANAVVMRELGTRELRPRRQPASRPESPLSERPTSRTPTPTEGTSEAHVPPKKRGRSKRH